MRQQGSSYEYVWWKKTFCFLFRGDLSILISENLPVPNSLLEPDSFMDLGHECMCEYAWNILCTPLIPSSKGDIRVLSGEKTGYRSRNLLYLSTRFSSTMNTTKTGEVGWFFMKKPHCADTVHVTDAFLTCRVVLMSKTHEISARNFDKREKKRPVVFFSE